MTDLILRVGQFEAGEMDEDEVIQFFQDLLDSGLIDHLQGYYGRTMAALITNGSVVPRSTP